MKRAFVVNFNHSENHHGRRELVGARHGGFILLDSATPDPAFLIPKHKPRFIGKVDQKHTARICQQVRVERNTIPDVSRCQRLVVARWLAPKTQSSSFGCESARIEMHVKSVLDFVGQSGTRQMGHLECANCQ
jgi:hypothetical protein